MPAWALLTYPGWLELAVGFFPYYNLHAWLEHPTLVWHPPYALPPARPALPLPEGPAAVLVSLGMDPLAALRWATVLALVLGTVGIFLWQGRRWGAWPGLAAALFWLYAPGTLANAYRVGFWGQFWVWAGVAWGLWLLARRWGRGEIPHWLGGGAFLAAWAVRAVDLPAQTAIWWGVGGVTLIAAAFVGRVAHGLRFRSPVPALAATALAAVLVVPWAQPRYVAYTPPARPVAIFGAADVVLLDASVSADPAPGIPLQVHTSWQVLRPQTTDWTFFVQVLDETNRIWGQYDGPLGGVERPTTRWRVGEVREEGVILPVAADAPPRLRLILGLYERTTLQRLTTQDGRDHVAIR